MTKKIFLSIVLAFFVLQAALAQGEENKVLWVKEIDKQVRICKFMPDDNFIMNNAYNLLQIRRTEDGGLVREVDFSQGLEYVDISKDGKYVAVVGIGKLFKILDINTLEVYRDFKLPIILWQSFEGVSSVSFSPDGSKLAATAMGHPHPEINSKIYIFDIESGEIIKELGDSVINWYYVKYSPDGKYLALAMRNYPYSVQIYDANTYELYWEPSNQGGAGGRIDDMEFSHDSKMLAIQNGVIGMPLRIYDIVEKTTILEEFNQEAWSRSFVFSPDDRRLYLSKPFLSYYDIYERNVVQVISNKINGLGSLYINIKGNKLISRSALGLVLFQIQSVSSISDKSINELNILFPNPTENTISLNYELNYPSDVSYIITNSIGEQIKQNDLGFFEPGNHELIINIGEIQTGAYFLRIITDKDSLTYKFVKE